VLEWARLNATFESGSDRNQESFGTATGRDGGSS